MGRDLGTRFGDAIWGREDEKGNAGGPFGPGAHAAHAAIACDGLATVSGGFAVLNPDSSLNINAVEAVPVDQLDVEAARRALAEAQKRVERATSDKDKVAAEIEVEVYTAVIAA